MVATTNLKPIRDDFITTIRAITPTRTELGQTGWTYVQSPDDVPGSDLRTFSLEFAPPRAEFGEDGLFNGGHSFVTAMRLHASYNGVNVEDVALLVEEDAADLFFALEARIGTGGLDGLLGVGDLPPDFVPDGASDDGSNLFGHFDFDVRYFRRDS